MFLLLSLIFQIFSVSTAHAANSCLEIFIKESNTVTVEELVPLILEATSQNAEPALSALILSRSDLENKVIEFSAYKEDLDVLASVEDVQSWQQSQDEQKKSAVWLLESDNLATLQQRLDTDSPLPLNAIFANERAAPFLKDFGIPLWTVRGFQDSTSRMDYEDAQKLVAEQGFLSRREFREWKDRPPGVPTKPDRFYRDRGWQGWAHFLGYAPPAKIKPYSEVQASVSQMGFKFREEYRNWQNRPEGFPVDPATTYKNKGWKGWEHFLGFVPYTRYNIKSYEEVRAVVATMGFRSHLDYKAWKDRPEGFPFSPYDVYRNHGWQGWPHFLGHEARTKPQTYVSAQALVSKWGFANRQEFRDWKERPAGIPTKPDVVYKNKGWQGWAHFLTPQNVKAFKQARELVRQQGFSRIKEFTYWVYKTKPEGIPLNPRSTYAKAGWQGWDDFLGTPKWMTYEEAKKVLIEAGIQSRKDFFEWADRPLRIPTDPAQHYAEFTTWADFLENPKLRISSFVVKILPYHEAQAIVARSGITSSKKYRDWKKPEGVPYDPQRIYLGKGWVDWPTYLGLKTSE